VSRKSNGALRATRDRATRDRQYELATRGMTRRERHQVESSDEYRPTRRDRAVARAAAQG
jgi:hypothetical protein